MRTLAIGDIHGALRALIQCLERCNYNPNHDKLIFLGDYIDSIIQNAEFSETIEYLINLKKENKNIIFIKGNHDVWADEYLNFGSTDRSWDSLGGSYTKKSYISNPEYLISKEHKNFFRQLHNYYVDDDNRAFVHGGYTSVKGLGHEYANHEYYWNRSLIEKSLICFKKGLSKPKLLESYYEIFIGHTTTMSLSNIENKIESKPINCYNLYDIDTGAGGYGKLTIMNVCNKKYWQSDLIEDLYKDKIRI